MEPFTKIVNGFAKRLTIEILEGAKYAQEFTNSSGRATLFSLNKDKKPPKIYKLEDTAYKSNAGKHL